MLFFAHHSRESVVGSVERLYIPKEEVGKIVVVVERKTRFAD